VPPECDPSLWVAFLKINGKTSHPAQLTPTLSDKLKIYDGFGNLAQIAAIGHNVGSDSDSRI
jgi:hypothetical protein